MQQNRAFSLSIPVESPDPFVPVSMVNGLTQSQWTLVQVGLMVTQDWHRKCTKIVHFLCQSLCNHQSHSQWTLVQVGLMITQDWHRKCTKMVHFLCQILCNHQTHLYQCPLWGLMITQDWHRKYTKIVHFLCQILCVITTPIWIPVSTVNGLTHSQWTLVQVRLMVTQDWHRKSKSCIFSVKSCV